MKTFSCGDVMPGCGRTFAARGEDELLDLVALHAAQDHGIVTLPPAIAQQMRSLIRTGA